MKERICSFVSPESAGSEICEGFPDKESFPEECPFRTFIFGTGFPEGCPYRDNSFGMGFPEGCPIRYARMRVGASPFDAYREKLSYIKKESGNMDKAPIKDVSAVRHVGADASSEIPEKPKSAVMPLGKTIDPFAASSPYFSNKSAEPVSYTSKEACGNDLSAAGDKAGKEFFAGKYIMGIAGALLFFGAAVVFLSSYWEYIPDILKLLIMSGTGAAVAAFGAFRIRANGGNPFISAVTGTGAGLIGISIMCAYMAFHMISLNAMLLLIALWAFCMIGSYYFIKQFYTVAIAYYGSFSISCIAFGSDSSMGTFGAVTVLMAVIGILMNILSKKWMTDSQQTACGYMNVMTAVILSFLSESLQSDPACLISQAALVCGIIGALHAAYEHEKNPSGAVIAFIFAAIASSFAIFSAFESVCSEFAPYFSIVLSAAVFFIIIRISERNKAISGAVFSAASVFASILSVLFLGCTGVPMGSSLFLAICLCFGNYSERAGFIRVIAGIDAALIVIFSMAAITKALLIPSLLIALLPSAFVMFRIFDESFESRISSMLVIMAAVTFVPAHVCCNAFASSYESVISGFLIILSLSAVIFCILLRSGWFACWNGDTGFVLKHFNSFFMRTDSDRISEKYSTFCCSFMCLIGIAGICGAAVCGLLSDSLHISGFFLLSFLWLFIEMLSLMIAKRPSLYWAGGLLSVSFLWTILLSCFHVSVLSFASSAAGFFIGFVSVFLGFMKSERRVRSFGMWLSVAMIVKCSLADVFAVLGSVEPAAVALSLAAAGLCCFGITRLYTYFEKRHGES